jgi:uncharacterized protein (DUF433 family)
LIYDEKTSRARLTVGESILAFGGGCALERRRWLSMALDYQQRIVRDPAVAGGQPVFKGTRVTLNTILSSLAEGASPEEILEDFPTLSIDDVRAAIAFAAASAQEDLPVSEVPVKR